MLFALSKLDAKEIQVIERIEETRQNLKYILSTPARWSGNLRRSTFARAIRGSNSIEGINVSEEDAIAAVQGEEPSEATKLDWAAVVCYRTAMTYVLQLASDPYFSYSEGFIRSLHYMMVQYDLTKNPGRWRPGAISVRDEQKNEIVYRAPDAEEVPKLMGELIGELRQQANDTPVIIRAAMGHLNLDMIHPFSDGNGRMARCLQTLILSREGILEAPFCSIEEYLGRNTQDYYNVLAEVGKGSWNPSNETKPWIRFCLTAHFRQATTLLRRSKEIKALWDQLEIEIKRRYLPNRFIFALADAAMGLKVRNSTYRSSADVTGFVASRDLLQLARSGFLVPSGEKRGRYYVASEVIKAIREQVREPGTSNEDPFA
ncbi:MAG: Fic family protein [Candidatus Binatota bacterium]